MNWVQEKANIALERIRLAKEQQVYPFFKQFESGGLHSTIDGRPIVNFSSNDYLGLTTHPKVKEASKKAVDTYSCGLSSSRVQATTTAPDVHNRLSGDGWDHHVFGGQRHHHHPRQPQPRLHPRRHLSRRRYAAQRP